MGKIHTRVSIACAILFSISGMISSIFRLHEYYNSESLRIQIELGYSIIYVDPTYVIEYVAFFICVPFYWYFFKFYFHGKESANRALKFVILGLSICLILILPVQIFEYKRQMSIASDHGFVDCPPFTLLSSTYIVEAMVKDPKYCTDDEITSIAMYGYFRELPIVNAYVDEVHGKKSVVN